jgi:hypothetical protein
MRLLALWLSVFVLLFALPVHADEPQPQPEETPEAQAYKRHLDLGIRLFEDRNYDAAMAEFEAAYEAQHRASPLINIALCHKGRFAYVKAIAMLERVLREHRDTAGEPEKLEKAIAEMRELLGTLEVKVSPPAAEPRLTLDGEDVPYGKPIEVSPGRHLLVVNAEGFAEAHREFRVVSGQVLPLTFTLFPDEGKLALTIEGLAAKVWIDGEPLVKKRRTLRLDAGTHLIELERDDDRYSASFAIVPGETTRVRLDEDGLLHVGGARPRGPDLVELPPITGPYVLVLFDIGPRFGEFTDLRVAPGLRLGYRIISEVAIEAEFHQVFNVIETADRDEVVGTTVARLNARLMTTTLPVRFVTTLGIGYAHDFDDVGSGNGFNVLVEPGVDVELSQVILGLATPVVVGVTSLNDGSLTFDFGGGLRVGYGFW